MTKREREVTDLDQISSFLDKSRIVHIGLCDGDQPYVVPMNYGYAMKDGKLTLYLHGALQGYKYEVMRKNPKVSFSIECDVKPFPGRLPCQYGMAYSSVMGKGTIEIIEDIKEKEKILTHFMKCQTGKDFTFDDRMVSIVNVMRVDVNEYTAKQRPVPPVEFEEEGKA